MRHPCAYETHTRTRAVDLACVSPFICILAYVPNTGNYYLQAHSRTHTDTNKYGSCC